MAGYTSFLWHMGPPDSLYCIIRWSSTDQRGIKVVPAASDGNDEPDYSYMTGQMHDGIMEMNVGRSTSWDEILDELVEETDLEITADQQAVKNATSMAKALIVTKRSADDLGEAVQEARAETKEAAEEVITLKRGLKEAQATVRDLEERLKKAREKRESCIAQQHLPQEQCDTNAALAACLHKQLREMFGSG
ncbi:hypothetical protein CALCODRAFT_487766 [Calocera cornea HHB12733]|uniref:Uncharacterized protein n=1 Tax=Calocera cornea HHB12733 TaxID=1353952 RepID=A0A165CXT7_9BASI|nr:hypothetical protein CALCODRAFT_487766 [Calocera cornea HHB12733]